MKKNIYNVLRGTFLISDDSFKNWRLIMFLSSLAIIMIASSHRADRKVYEIAGLKEEVKEGLKKELEEDKDEMNDLKKK